METADVMVALGGDKGNTVPRYAVTASEIAVLRAIHGNEAVFDIEPKGDVKRSHRDERERLIYQYRAKDNNGKQIAAEMFPGAAARMFETIAELELDEEFFKTETRTTAAAPKPAKKGGKKDVKDEGAVDNDGIGDL